MWSLPNILYVFLYEQLTNYFNGIYRALVYYSLQVNQPQSVNVLIPISKCLCGEKCFVKKNKGRPSKKQCSKLHSKLNLRYDTKLAGNELVDLKTFLSSCLCDRFSL